MNFNKIKEFLQADKLLHILASALIYIVIGAVMITRMGPWMYDAVIVPYLASIFITFFIGMGKETYDSYFKGSSEGGDLIADVIGIGLGLILLLIIFV